MNKKKCILEDFWLKSVPVWRGSIQITKDTKDKLVRDEFFRFLKV